MTKNRNIGDILDAPDLPVDSGGIANEFSYGVVSSGTTTMDMGSGPMQKITANGAFTLAPGSNTGNVLLAITNGSSAGTITTSGWTNVVGSAFDTTSGHKFMCHCSVSAVGSLMIVQAMQ